jgi:hypothetical protein
LQLVIKDIKWSEEMYGLTVTLLLHVLTMVVMLAKCSAYFLSLCHGSLSVFVGHIKSISLLATTYLSSFHFRIVLPRLCVKILQDPEICDVRQGSCVGNGSVMQRFKVR